MGKQSAEEAGTDWMLVYSLPSYFPSASTAFWDDKLQVIWHILPLLQVCTERWPGKLRVQQGTTKGQEKKVLSVSWETIIYSMNTSACWQYLLANCRMCKFSLLPDCSRGVGYAVPNSASSAEGPRAKNFNALHFCSLFTYVLFIHHLLKQDSLYSKMPGCNHGRRGRLLNSAELTETCH